MDLERSQERPVVTDQYQRARIRAQRFIDFTQGVRIKMIARLIQDESVDRARQSLPEEVERERQGLAHRWDSPLGGV